MNYHNDKRMSWFVNLMECLWIVYKESTGNRFIFNITIIIIVIIIIIICLNYYF